MAESAPATARVGLASAGGDAAAATTVAAGFQLQPPKPLVTIVSSDGIKFQAPRDAIELSGLLRTTIGATSGNGGSVGQGGGSSSGNSGSGQEGEELPLPNVRSTVLKSVLDFLKYALSCVVLVRWTCEPVSALLLLSVVAPLSLAPVFPPCPCFPLPSSLRRRGLPPPLHPTPPSPPLTCVPVHAKSFSFAIRNDSITENRQHEEKNPTRNTLVMQQSQKKVPRRPPAARVREASAGRHLRPGLVAVRRQLHREGPHTAGDLRHHRRRHVCKCVQLCAPVPSGPLPTRLGT
jgi:hypothetical protein